MDSSPVSSLWKGRGDSHTQFITLQHGRPVHFSVYTTEEAHGLPSTICSSYEYVGDLWPATHFLLHQITCSILHEAYGLQNHVCSLHNFTGEAFHAATKEAWGLQYCSLIMKRQRRLMDSHTQSITLQHGRPVNFSVCTTEEAHELPSIIC